MDRAFLDLAPCGPLRGALRVPGDKSVTHRGLMLLALSEGEGRLFYPLKAGDTLSTARALQALGAEIAEEGPHFRVRGRGLSLKEPEDVLDCGNAGTLTRLLLGILPRQDAQEEAHEGPGVPAVQDVLGLLEAKAPAPHAEVRAFLHDLRPQGLQDPGGGEGIPGLQGVKKPSLSLRQGEEHEAPVGHGLVPGHPQGPPQGATGPKVQVLSLIHISEPTRPY